MNTVPEKGALQPEPNLAPVPEIKPAQPILKNKMAPPPKK